MRQSPRRPPRWRPAFAILPEKLALGADRATWGPMAVVSGAGGVHRGEDACHDPSEGKRHGSEFTSFGHGFHLLVFSVAPCFRATTGPCSRSLLAAVPH